MLMRLVSVGGSDPLEDTEGQGCREAGTTSLHLFYAMFLVLKMKYARHNRT